jgi:hypothetical protein
MADPTSIEVLTSAARAALGQTGRYTVIELLAREDAAVAAQVYAALQVDLYWKRKDLPGVVAVSLAGIQHALTAAHASGDDADAFLGSAKQLAYNLASFTWPGWDEPGLVPTPAEVAIGLEAAQLNCRLADELNRPDGAKAKALWTLGAHQLAAGQLGRAADTFRSAEIHAVRAGAVLDQRMLRAYAALADLIADGSNGTAAAALKSEWDALAEEGSEDAMAYARQIRVARNWFGRGKGYDGPDWGTPSP